MQVRADGGELWFAVRLRAADGRAALQDTLARFADAPLTSCDPFGYDRRQVVDATVARELVISCDSPDG